MNLNIDFWWKDLKLIKPGKVIVMKPNTVSSKFKRVNLTAGGSVMKRMKKVTISVLLGVILVMQG